MEVVNLCDLPNEILCKVFSIADNDKNLSLVCKRFYDIVSLVNEDNTVLEIASESLINPNFDFTQFLNDASKIKLRINFQSIKNFDEKFTAFLQSHGDKVVDLTHINPADFNITKFIRLMPKIETLLINVSKEAMPTNGIEKHSIPLKQLIVPRCKLIKWETLEVFDVEELEIDSMPSVGGETTLAFIENCVNLRQFKVSIADQAPQLLNVLSGKSFDVLELNVYRLSENEIVKFIETQRSLRKLQLNCVTTKILKTICNVCTKLESLNVTFEEEIDRKIMEKLSKLKSLKSLVIEDNLYMQMNMKNNAGSLLSFTLPKLESLESLTEISHDDIKVLAKHFKGLKSLKLRATTSDYHKTLERVLKTFTQLEHLSVMTDGYNLNVESEVSGEFYTLSHKSETIKSLNIDVRLYDAEKLLQKILRDFPNLEKFPDGYLSTHVLLFVEKVKNYSVASVDLECAENPNEMLKGCSVYSSKESIGYNKVGVKRDGKGEITLNVEKYFRWKKLQTLLTSARRFKSLALTLNPEHDRVAVDNFSQYLTVIGERIRELKISNKITLYELKRVMESLVNLETVHLFQVQVADPDEEFLVVNNGKIKSLCFRFNLDLNEDTNVDEVFKTFCNHLRFPDNCLEHLCLTIRSNYQFEFTIDQESTTNFLKNQIKLVEGEESWTLEGFNEKFTFVTQSEDFCEIRSKFDMLH